MMVSFVLSFFPRDVLDEILNLIESVSEDFPSYSYIVKDMLKNPYNVIYVILTFISFSVYICLILGAKYKNWCAEKSERREYICFNILIYKNKLNSSAVTINM